MNILSRFILKLLLLLGLAVFALVNYRYLSFDKGWSNFGENSNGSFTAESFYDYIPTKIEYYEKTIKNNEYDYRIFIKTNGGNYLFEATAQDITALEALGMIVPTFRPQQITPIPFYVEIILGIIILVLPFGRKRKQKK